MNRPILKTDGELCTQPAQATTSCQKTLLAIRGAGPEKQISLIEKIIAKLDNCKNAWAISYNIHVASGKVEIKAEPLICGERICLGCLEQRIKAIKSRLRPIWQSINPLVPLTHIIPTFSPVPRPKMTKKLYQELRHKLRLFLRRLSRTKYKNHWGFGILELKYIPSKNCYKPHFHLINFGRTIPAEELQNIWTAVNHKFQKCKVFYSPTKKPGESKEKYTDRLVSRKFKMLGYFAKRVAGAGLVFDDVKTDTGGTRNIPIGQIPMGDYSRLIKHSRLFFGYGKRQRPKTIYMADKTPIPTNVPKGVLQRCEQLCQENADKSKEWERFHLGVVPAGHRIAENDHPPPWATDKKDLEARFNDLADSEMSEVFTVAQLWRLAFLELLEEHTDGVTSVVMLNQIPRESSRISGVGGAG